MKKRRMAVLSISALVVGAALTAPNQAVADIPHKSLARNVIVLVDDGAGYNHHEAGSLFDTGMRTGEVYNDFPVQLAVSTYSFGDVPVGGCLTPVGYDPDQAWADFDYVRNDPTDSAAAATAMATGIKTYDSAIGVDCMGKVVKNISEDFESAGRSTGVVTSVPVSHATPAGFAVHNVDRDSWVPIARDMVESSAIDVVMGAGHPWYDREGNAVTTASHTWIGRTVWNGLVAGTAGGNADLEPDIEHWTLLQSRSAFQQLMTGDTPERVFGVAQVRRTLQLDRAGDTSATPFEVPLNDRVPTLAEMATGALNVLDNDEDGFFLMVEGGATDLAAHDGLVSRMVEEEIAFDRAVDAALQWVDTHSNWGETVVIVTSDHETGYLVGPGSGSTPEGPVWLPVGDNGQGMMPSLVLLSETHTNSLVPFYAKGDAARVFRWLADEHDPLRGRYLDNTEIHQGLVDALGPR